MSRLLRLSVPLVALLLTLGAAPAHGGLLDDLFGKDPKPASGTVRSPDRVLKHGCQRHGFRYRLDVPSGNAWALEVSLVDRRTNRIAGSSYLVSGADPERGKAHFRFCSQNVRPGRYKVISRLTWSDYSKQFVKRLANDQVRLRRR